MIESQDYNEWAVIRLATLQDERKQPGRLLFATVTLLSPGRPASTKMDGLDQCSILKSTSTVFFRRVVLTKKAAIDWYRSLGNGNEKTPRPSQDKDIEKGIDGVAFAVSQLEDDLIWPHLGLPMGEDGFSQPSGQSHPAPFIGNTYARIHRRFGSQEGFEALLADDNAVTFIARRLHVDLRQYSEYLGSAAYIAPDPIIEKIDNFMIPSEGGRGERIFYHFVPRRGQTLEGLKLTTFDELTNLLTSFDAIDIPDDGILDIDKGSCIGTYGYVVTHKTHGVLAYMPLTGFFREMNLTTNIVNRRRKISVPTSESPNSPHMEYHVESHSNMESSNVIGKAENISSNSLERVNTASYQRQKINNAKTYGQCWFDNNSREVAMRFIQGEIKKARSRVIIADPYLADLQLGQFLYAVSGAKIEVMLLTSTLAFKNGESTANSVNAFKERLDKLEKDASIKAKTYVLAPSLLHDRFLVIDEDVWFLGNSLNSLGDKSSLIVKLPNPDDVIEKLITMSAKADNIENYLQKI